METVRRTRSDTKAQTRSDLIAAARQVFLARGFHQATLDEIAEQAGYTKGAVYSNFAGKDDLFLALLEEHYVRRTEAYTDVFVSAESEEQIYRAVAQVMLDAYAREPAWWPLISDFASHAACQTSSRAAAISVAMSAIMKLTPWCIAIGTSKVTRCLAYSTAYS